MKKPLIFLVILFALLWLEPVARVRFLLERCAHEKVSIVSHYSYLYQNIVDIGCEAGFTSMTFNF